MLDKIAANDTRTIIEWSNEMGARGRPALLFFVREDEVIEFRGETIPGLAVVTSSRWRKNGKWSGTKFTIAVAPHVRMLRGHMGFDSGTLTEALLRDKPATWANVATALGVSRESAERFIRASFERAAARIDEVEAQLSALDGCDSPPTTHPILGQR